MAEFVVVIVAWFASGLVGSFLVLNYGWRLNRNYPLDIDVGDILAGLVAALAGPINLLIGIVFFIAWVFAGAVDMSRVVFPARR